MFPTRKSTWFIHVSGQVIRTAAAHPFYVEGKGWVNAGDLPGAKSDGEQVVYNLNLGDPAMPDQPRPSFPILGFVAGTPILTAQGPVPIEDLKPGDLIETQPGDDQADDKPEAHDEPRWWESN
jgi:hypothetical protein